MVLWQYRQKNFAQLAAYLAWGESGADSRRVAWTAARNLPTDEPELAARFMRATAAQSDRVAKPVYHIIVGFASRDQVDRALMERVADQLLERLGLSEHQAVLVAHRDEPRQHFHIMVNRVHPDHSRSWSTWRDWPRAREVAREQERALGLSAPQFGHREWGRLRERIATLASDLQTYERVTTLTRERYEAQLGGSAVGEARIRAELQALPERAELERRIGRLLDYVWPLQIRRLRALVTAPQLALAREVRRLARGVARARAEEHEHSR